MKLPFSAIFSAFAFLAAANAQGIYINYPSNGTTLVAGQNTTVQIVEPIYIQSVTDVGIAIGLVSCLNGISSCPDPQEELGDILYAGPFMPQLLGQPGPYQNFTVQVPESANGVSQLAVVRFFLVGAGETSVLGNASVDVMIGG